MEFGKLKFQDAFNLQPFDLDEFKDLLEDKLREVAV